MTISGMTISSRTTMNTDTTFEIHTVAQSPELGEEILALFQAGWVRFLVEDSVSWPLWKPILEAFPDFHFAFVEPHTQQIMAAGMTVPLAWNGELSELLHYGWHWVLQQSLDDYRHRRALHTLSAANAVVHPKFRGCGLAEQIVFQMKRTAEKHGFRRYIAPLRPTHKEKYPLTPIERYAEWTREDGLPFDPWLRVQKRLGAQIIGCARESIRIEAPLVRWSEWTGLKFPDSGSYIVPGGAVPMEADCVRGIGYYVAPSIWIAHTLPILKKD